MKDLLNRIIKLNIEFEGVLRTMLERPSKEILSVAQDKFDELSGLFNQMTASEQNVEDESNLTEIKIEEAEGSEESPMTEPDLSLKPTDFRKMFTLNDKFMFRKGLFGNNDEEFNSTLDLVGAMHSYEEVEEYVYDDLQWDSTDPLVVDFMKIAHRFFAN